MTLLSFKTVILSKSNNRSELPADPQLIEKIFTGLKRIAKDTVPLRLVIVDGTGQQILRKVDEYGFIRFPFRPLNDESVIDIDDALLDALALFVMAGMEIPRAKTLMGMYYAEIEFNNERLIETYLSSASNDSPDINTQMEFA